jgi:hypothetical protein
MAAVTVDQGQLQVERVDRDLRTKAGIWENFNAALAPFKAEAPQGELGESVVAYQRRVSNLARRVLPPSHELKKIEFTRVPSGPALDNLSDEMLKALSKVAWDPSTVERVPDGESPVYRVIETVDKNTNMAQRHFVGSQSFVKDFAVGWRPGRRVERIVAPRNNEVTVYESPHAKRGGRYNY